MNKKLLTFLSVLLCACPGILTAQNNGPVRTRWISPDNSKPMTYREWKADWDSTPRIQGGEVKYRSAAFQKTMIDSFAFGDNYAYYKGFVRHDNNELCRHLPPGASFFVTLNGDDNHILTDESPRWAFGDPNISGQGWYGIELGNFDNPAVAPGDSFSIFYTCYTPNELAEQGSITDFVTILPLINFPTNLHMQYAAVPEPPGGLRLQRLSGGIEIKWEKQSGISYSIYRRSLQDTLVSNFPRYLYSKIAEGISDSIWFDTTIDSARTYGYVLFAVENSSGLRSGRSREIRETESLRQVRLMIVQPELYFSVEDQVLQTAADWEAEGAEVLVYAMQFSDAKTLRDTLRKIEDLQGVLLMGDFPVPWFQFDEDTGGHYQEYPADLYYMDLDGVWQDLKHQTATGLAAGPDGILDTHTADYPRADEAPDIVVGRITPTAGMGNAAGIINFYLDKVHRYRLDIGAIRKDFKALAYPDDDWFQWGHDVSELYMPLAYPQVDCIWDINATTGVDYRDRLDNSYSLIHVYVHSWSGGHAFKVNNGLQNQYFYNSSILPAGTDANFYLLFACGNSRYVEDQYCAGIYTFQTTAGISSIGTTHSGGMLDYNIFYPELAKGISFGQAFLRTFQEVGRNGFSDNARSWYYGMTFNGDPFVVPQPSAMVNLANSNVPAVPSGIQLANYPNPFNASTQIRFTLPAAGPVSLKVYNILGGEVIELLHQWMPSGRQEFYFDGSRLPGGIYFIRLQSGSYSRIQKMTLLK
ncbi:MAG: T9SS type A sorting domain-containing protein [Calditrichia bacterium]